MIIYWKGNADNSKRIKKSWKHQVVYIFLKNWIACITTNRQKLMLTNGTFSPHTVCRILEVTADRHANSHQYNIVNESQFQRKYSFVRMSQDVSLLISDLDQTEVFCACAYSRHFSHSPFPSKPFSSSTVSGNSLEQNPTHLNTFLIERGILIKEITDFSRCTPVLRCSDTHLQREEEIKQKNMLIAKSKTLARKSHDVRLHPHLHTKNICAI